MITTALLPPSSRIDFPNLLRTSAATLLPTAVDPVNDTNGMRGSYTIALPMSGPSPVTTVRTLLKPFFASTSVTILPRATVTSEAVSAPFQIN